MLEKNCLTNKNYFCHQWIFCSRCLQKLQPSGFHCDGERATWTDIPVPFSRGVEIRPTTHEEHAGVARCGARAYRDIDRPRAILDNTHTRTHGYTSGRAGGGIRSAGRTSMRKRESGLRFSRIVWVSKERFPSSSRVTKSNKNRWSSRINKASKSGWSVMEKENYANYSANPILKLYVLIYSVGCC